MKNSIVYVILLLGLGTNAFSQKKKSSKLGQTTIEELKMQYYDKDSTAKALYLFDHANVYIDKDYDYDFRTDYYERVKLFDKSEFNRATIKINVYKKQRVKNIKAITYNLKSGKIEKFFLTEDKIFTNQISKNWKEVTFTLPNLKEGCVIEYSYSILSPYSKIKDWYFQSDIPKVKSKFTSSILGNWKYKVRLIGLEKLTKNDITVSRKCLYVPGAGAGDCIVQDFEMENVPAFKEEGYMLSKKNFISRLALELISFTSIEGTTTKYTKTWKDADKTFRLNFLDGQTSKKSYFKKKLPKELLTISNPLEKAKQAYYYLRKRMTWNGDFWSSKKINVKKTYINKTGSVDEINLVLYNALKALGIKSYIVMLSTRKNGLPTKLYPVVDDFNYVIVKVIINEKSYFLDITDRFLPFGEIPMRCLNGEGRVLDFKKGSYWESLSPKFTTSSRAKIELSYDSEDNLSGKMKVSKTGYDAMSERKRITNLSKSDYLDYFETNHPNIEVKTVNFKDNDESKLFIDYALNIENLSESPGIIKFNPFIIDRVNKNPFKLNERTYPVDFGYPYSQSYLLYLTVPDGFKIKKTPENKAIGLPEKGGKFLLKVTTENNKLKVYTKLEISKKIYSNIEYYYLKEFFNQIIKAQNSFIELEKQ